MRKILFFISLCAAAAVYAVNIPQGTFYYDNGKTGYSHVKFVYGNNSVSYVKSMSPLTQTTCGHTASTTWQITFSQAVQNMYRYSFAQTDLADGTYNKSFTTLKDEISNTRNELRTATREDAFGADDIFIPSSGDNWAQGAWTALCAPAAVASGTLPVLYIDTENGKEIVSEEEYINATYHLDNDAPQPMQIRGRGNYTWRDFDKKPYRLKLESKAALLGMAKSKHWALLAHADDTYGFMRNALGFWLSKRIGLKWTPSQEPVEVILNGQYWGLYFLTETIRVDKTRVNIVEQPDLLNAVSDSITGGWLVEIDNYYSESGQVHMTEGNGENIMITLHTPELTSQHQWNYISSQMTALDKAIYGNYPEQLIDLDEAAKYYIVQEIMEDCESYHGSCYLYKDMGTDKKWMWGPVWDFGNSFERHADRFIWDRPIWSQVWIGQLYTNTSFQKLVKKYWQHFLYYDYADLSSYIDSYVSLISAAAKNDAARWPQYGNSNMSDKKQKVKDRLSWRTNWLKQQWGEGKQDTGVEELRVDSVEFRGKYIHNGRLIIRHNGKTYNAYGAVVR
ncbi:MAG: CotH kinase family protein [Paludibacteraceae bacterium]|nr:CotH kinase family protein [Paludibacteraceae bacterium]